MNNGIFRSAKEVAAAFQRAVSKGILPQSGPLFEGLKKQVLFYKQLGPPDSPLQTFSQTAAPPATVEAGLSQQQAAKARPRTRRGRGRGRPQTPAADRIAAGGAGQTRKQVTGRVAAATAPKATAETALRAESDQSERREANAGKKKAALREWRHFPLKKAFRPQESLPAFPEAPRFFPTPAAADSDSKTYQTGINQMAPPPLLPEAFALPVANGSLPQNFKALEGVKIWNRRSFLKEGKAPPLSVQKKILEVLGAKRDGLCCLNNLFSEDILILSVEKSLLQPLEIQFLSALAFGEAGVSQASFRLFVFVKEGVKAEIFETFHKIRFPSSETAASSALSADAVARQKDATAKIRRSDLKIPVLENPPDPPYQGGTAQNLPYQGGSRLSEKPDLQNRSSQTGLIYLQTDCFVGAGAELDYIRLGYSGERGARSGAQTELAESGDRGSLLNRLFGHIERAGQARFLTISLHPAQSRFETVLGQKEKSRSEIRGFSLLSGRGSAEHRVSVFHLEKEGESNQLYQSLVLDSAKHAFRGLISIAKGAQKTKAGQLSGNRLLGEKAFCAVSPELDVLADDVKANHGASVSSLEESREALFYLQSRGLSRGKALELITEGAVHAPLSASKERTRAVLFALIRNALQKAAPAAS